MSTTDRIKSLLDERHAAGLAKYGVTVDRDDLTPEQWCQHAIEEGLDGVAYLMRLKDTLGHLRARLLWLEDYVRRGYVIEADGQWIHARRGIMRIVARDLPELGDMLVMMPRCCDTAAQSPQIVAASQDGATPPRNPCSTATEGQP